LSAEVVIIFEVLDVIIFICREFNNFLWCKWYHFELLDVIIFHGVNVIIFEVLDAIILEVPDVIIFHGVVETGILYVFVVV
jgi:hypothetical protein